MAAAGLYRRKLPSPPAIEFASPEGKVSHLEFPSIPFFLLSDPAVAEAILRLALGIFPSFDFMERTDSSSYLLSMLFGVRGFYKFNSWEFCLRTEFLHSVQ